MFDPTGPVLGIDPGLSRCGYGAVSGRGAALAAVSYGVISTDPTTPLPERLVQLASELDRLVAELAPSALAVERVLFQTNARTAILGRSGQRTRVGRGCPPRDPGDAVQPE